MYTLVRFDGEKKRRSRGGWLAADRKEGFVHVYMFMIYTKIHRLQLEVEVEVEAVVEFRYVWWVSEKEEG